MNIIEEVKIAIMKLNVEKLLKRPNYPQSKLDRVLDCVKSQNATNIKESCVADADLLFHMAI